MKKGYNTPLNSDCGFSHFDGIGLHFNLGVESQIKYWMFIGLQVKYSLKSWVGYFSTGGKSNGFSESSFEYLMGLRLRLPFI